MPPDLPPLKTRFYPRLARALFMSVLMHRSTGFWGRAGWALQQISRSRELMHFDAPGGGRCGPWACRAPGRGNGCLGGTPKPLAPAGEQSHRHLRCVLPLNQRRFMWGMSLMRSDPLPSARRSRSFYISMSGFWLLSELALLSNKSPMRPRVAASVSSSIMACIRWSVGSDASMASISRTAVSR